MSTRHTATEDLACYHCALSGNMTPTTTFAAMWNDHDQDRISGAVFHVCRSCLDAGVPGLGYQRVLRTLDDAHGILCGYGLAAWVRAYEGTDSDGESRDPQELLGCHPEAHKLFLMTSPLDELIAWCKKQQVRQ